jgi:hypothetical protein
VRAKKYTVTNVENGHNPVTVSVAPVARVYERKPSPNKHCLGIN